jgi:predicted AlkP superfamily pyrophosphatase or phosphodiesterase
MKKLIFLVIFLLTSPFLHAQGLKENVILISIDGLRPEFYLDPAFPAPHLQEMAREGLYARYVRGVFPSVTYPSHTTLITGAKPARHGILYNSPFEEGGQTGKWYWHFDEIKVPTIWDLVQANGGSSASLFWPVSVGAPVTYNIPEYWDLDRRKDMFDAIRPHVAPEGFLDELFEHATGKLNSLNFNGDGLNREARVAYMADYILGKYQPNFMTIHLISTDHFQHEGGREGQKVKKAVAAADYAVGQILESVEKHGLKDHTTIIITGDHGFVDIHTKIKPNVWLVEAGLQQAAKDRGNWKAAFHTSGASAFLILKDKKDRKTVAAVRKKMQTLPDSIQAMFRIVEKEELAKVGASPEAAFALAPVEGISFGGSNQGPALTRASGGTHGFFPDLPNIHTGFIAIGPKVQKNTKIEMMGLEDVAPFILETLQIKAKTPDGKDLLKVTSRKK